MQGKELPREHCAWRLCFFTFQLTTYIYFLNLARRPQSRKGRLAAKTKRGKGGLLCVRN